MVLENLTSENWLFILLILLEIQLFLVWMKTWRITQVGKDN
jgi:hypothetical protein